MREKSELLEVKLEDTFRHSSIMSSSQVNPTITGNENVAAGRDANIINFHLATNPTAAKKPKIWKSFCTVTAPTPNFTGREDLIATIHCQIQQCSLETEYFKKIVVIYGLGGIGKSELARKYVQMHIQHPSILNAAWIDAESKNSLESSFKSLAETLSLQTKDKEVKDVVLSIYNHLAEHSQPSLFIFDNVEQMRSEDNVFGIFEFLPTVKRDCLPLIIITTRVNNWEIPENPKNIIQINELSEDAAVEFLTKRLKLSSKQKRDETTMYALEDLARNLQCFPLGLTLAASNIPVSKLRSIPKEIKVYIQKLNGPHGDWIKERHSTGTAGKYDLIMNNVWAATLDKIKSKGDDGEAAISILNSIAYFVPNEITVNKVVEVAEFNGLHTSIAAIEMLELYSLISLPSSTDDDVDFDDERSSIEDGDTDNKTNQKILIHRLVQRCTRDKLDREKNYSYLLNISMFLAHQKLYFADRRAIHQYLKERMWPENSIQFSVLFASEIIDINSIFEILKDVHEVLVLEKKPSYAKHVTEDCKILHALNLFYVSTNDEVDKILFEDLISKDLSYSKNYLEQVFISSLGKCVKDLFMGSVGEEDLVKRDSINLLIKSLARSGEPKLSKKAQEEISSMLADATGSSFKGNVGTACLLYSLLEGIFCCCKSASVCWYVDSVLKIHGSVYASISEIGGAQLERYWTFDPPIPYLPILFNLMDLKKTSNAESNRSIVESFSTEAGRQFLLQYLQFLDGLTQTKIDELSGDWLVLDLVLLLGLKWDCPKKFVQTNLFMETLYSITKRIFKWNVKEFRQEKFQCLLTWFGLFGKRTCVDRNGVSWSIYSVEKEMIMLLDTSDSVEKVGPVFGSFIFEGEAVLKEFIITSGSDQECIAVKVATRMLEYLKSTFPFSMSGL